MASSPVAIAPNSKLDWRKMNKQELRDALASRGLDTNGLRPLLIQRLESSSKASVAAEALSTAAGAVETLLSKNETLALTSQKETLTLTLQNETLTLTSQKETLPRKWQEETLTLNKQKETLTLKLQEDVTDENAEFEDPRECDTVSRAVTGNEAPDANLKVSSPKSDGTRAKVAPISGAEIGKRDLNGGNGSTTGSLSNLDKKRRRAERFGVGLQVSEEEKLALRAERFAGAQGKKKDSVQEPESEKRKQRAERFGIVDEATRKKARQERFPPASKQDESVEVGKRKARAARFGAASDQSGSKENTSSKSQVLGDRCQWHEG